MGCNTKFSRLLKGLLIAARDHLQQNRLASESQAPLPPPPMSAGDLYFFPSNGVVDTSATPLQYGLDALHSSEEKGLELFFKYHPIATTSQPQPSKQSTEMAPIMTTEQSMVVQVPHQPPISKPVSSPAQPVTDLPNAMPPPPRRIPSSRASPTNRSFGGSRTTTPPHVPTHRSPQRQSQDAADNPPQRSQKIYTGVEGQREAQPTSHLRTTVGPRKVTSYSQSSRRETPHRRIPLHEPKTASQFSLPQSLIPWPNEIPFRATLPESVPNLTNRSTFQMRRTTTDESILSRKGPGGMSPRHVRERQVLSDVRAQHSVAESRESLPRERDQKRELSEPLRSELDSELAKALSLLRLNGPSTNKPQFFNVPQRSTSRRAGNRTRPASASTSEDELPPVHVISDLSGNAPPIVSSEVLNFHSQLMHQLKLDRQRQSNLRTSNHADS